MEDIKVPFEPNIDSEIPLQATVLPQEEEDPESIPYVISFERYNGKECEIDILNKNQPRKILNVIKMVGTEIFSEADFSKKGLKIKPIGQGGEYNKLRRGLGTDIDLKEIILQSTNRIFYFTVESVKKFYIVAIRANHYETDKVRR